VSPSFKSHPELERPKSVSRCSQICPLDFLKSLDDERLGQPLDPGRPTRSIATMVQSFIVEHGWWHLGEVKYIKGLLGMPAPR